MIILTRKLWNNNVDQLNSIAQRIRHDSHKIRDVCKKHRGSTNPWLPISMSNNSLFNVRNYYLDGDKKIGWCVNAKVTSYDTIKHFLLITLY